MGGSYDPVHSALFCEFRKMGDVNGGRICLPAVHHLRQRGLIHACENRDGNNEGALPGR